MSKVVKRKFEGQLGMTIEVVYVTSPAYSNMNYVNFIIADKDEPSRNYKHMTLEMPAFAQLVEFINHPTRWSAEDLSTNLANTILNCDPSDLEDLQNAVREHLTGAS
jgi:hypothetical protein